VCLVPLYQDNVVALATELRSEPPDEFKTARAAADDHYLGLHADTIRLSAIDLIPKELLRTFKPMGPSAQASRRKTARRS
jgi:hypothetical protein